jgi:hypothetical protein
MSREREESGQYTETVTLADVLDVFEAVAGPVVTSGDVADDLDCSRETAGRKTAGQVVWWLVDTTDAREGDSGDTTDAREVDPGDPFWELEPGASGESEVFERVDEVLYGDS